jgi:hypothetical protein
MADLIKKRDLQEWLMFCEQVQNTTNIPFQEDEKQQNIRIAKALADYNFFVKTYFPLYADADCGYFHKAAANHIASDPNCFAILEWPREHAKSVHANILIPMWLMAKGELTGMILMGKNGEDAANLFQIYRHSCNTINSMHTTLAIATIWAAGKQETLQPKQAYVLFQ